MLVGMKTSTAVAAALFCCLSCPVLLGQQDTGPAFAKLPIGPPAKVAIPAKFDAPYVLLKLSVDGDGTAQDVQVTKSAGAALDAKAVEAASASRFPQHTQNGQPVKYGLQLAVTMGAAVQAGGDPVAQIHQVKPPLVVFTAPPEFPEEAKRKQIAGNVLVGLIVDEKGRPQNVHVVRGVGYGLDEKAMESVRKYRFSPATLEDKAIAIPINVEVNFQYF
jgi:TonB family protein